MVTRNKHGATWPLSRVSVKLPSAADVPLALPTVQLAVTLPPAMAAPVAAVPVRVKAAAPGAVATGVTPVAPGAASSLPPHADSSVVAKSVVKSAADNAERGK